MSGIVKLKIELPTGKKTASHPGLPQTLGQKGIPLPIFVKNFEEITKKYPEGKTVIAKITYFKKKLTVVIGEPKLATLVRQRIGIEKFSSTPGKGDALSISTEDIKEIAKIKINDNQTTSLENSIKVVIGSLQSIGVTVK